MESSTVDEDEWTYEWFLEIRVERLGYPPLTDKYEKLFRTYEWGKILILSNLRWHRGLNRPL